MPSACCALSSSPLRHAAPSDSIHLVTQCLTAANKRGFERILVPINAATQAEGGEAGGAGGGRAGGLVGGGRAGGVGALEAAVVAGQDPECASGGARGIS